MTTETRLIDQLRSHPLNATIYGEIDADPAFIESIREEGIISPLTVDQDDNIISGHRRWHAARALGLDRVPVVVRAIADPLDATRLLIEANRQREKSYSQRMREADEWAGVMAAQGIARMSEGGQRFGRGMGSTDRVAPHGATLSADEVDATTERLNARRNRTFQRERYIWHIAEERGGDREAASLVARALVEKLDAKTITPFVAEQQLREAVDATERRAALPPESGTEMAARGGVRPASGVASLGQETPTVIRAADAPGLLPAAPDPWDDPDADPDAGLYARPEPPEWLHGTLVDAGYIAPTSQPLPPAPPPPDEHAELTDTILGADAAINDGGVAKHLLLSKLGRDVRHLLLSFKEDEVCAALERYPELDHLFTDLHRLRRLIANIERRQTVIRGGQGVG